MNTADLLDLLADVLDRIRHTRLRHWGVLGLIAAGVGLVVTTLTVADHFRPALSVLVIAVGVLTVILPRGHLGTVFVVLSVLWALVGTDQSDVGWLVLVALGLVAVSWGGFLAGLGPSYATWTGAGWRALLVPLLVALLGIGVAVLLVVLLDPVTLPGSWLAVLTPLVVLTITLTVLLWPSGSRWASPARPAR